jgi:hypothetical protein
MPDTYEDKVDALFQLVVSLRLLQAQLSKLMVSLELVSDSEKMEVLGLKLYEYLNTCSNDDDPLTNGERLFILNTISVATMDGVLKDTTASLHRVNKSIH